MTCIAAHDSASQKHFNNSLALAPQKSQCSRDKLVKSFPQRRYLLRDAVQRLVDKHKTMSALYRVLGRSGFKVGVLLRLSPIIPFNALNYAISLTPISLASYTLSTFLGIIPGTCLFVYIGSTAKSVRVHTNSPSRRAHPLT